MKDLASITGSLIQIKGLILTGQVGLKFGCQADGLRRSSILLDAPMAIDGNGDLKMMC